MRRPRRDLTPRQRQIVEMLSWGLTCPVIAERLEIEERTVRRHVEDIDRAMDEMGLSKHLKPIRRIVLNARELLEAS